MSLTLVLIRWHWRDLLAGIARRVFRFRPAWFDPAAFQRFFVIGGDIVICTVLILLSEAVLLNNAATIGDLSLATAQLVLVMFSLISFGLDGYAHAAEALVGEAIGRRNLPMLDQVVRRTNILAGISAPVISISAWAGGPLIIATLTSQADLAAKTLAHWHWVALLVGGLHGLPDGRHFHRRHTEPRDAQRDDPGLCRVPAGDPGGRRLRLNGLLAAYDISRAARHHADDADAACPSHGDA